MLLTPIFSKYGHRFEKWSKEFPERLLDGTLEVSPSSDDTDFHSQSIIFYPRHIV